MKITDFKLDFVSENKTEIEFEKENIEIREKQQITFENGKKKIIP